MGGGVKGRSPQGVDLGFSEIKPPARRAQWGFHCGHSRAYRGGARGVGACLARGGGAEFSRCAGRGGGARGAVGSASPSRRAVGSSSESMVRSTTHRAAVAEVARCELGPCMCCCGADVSSPSLSLLKSIASSDVLIVRTIAGVSGATAQCKRLL